MPGIASVSAARKPMPRGAALPRLRECDLSVTSRCNLSCGFCSVDVAPVTASCDELGMDELANLFDQFESLGLESLRIAGGEPFVRRDIGEILALTRGRRFRTSILTNAAVLRQDHVHMVRDCDIDLLAISLDGPSAKVHDRSRGQRGIYAQVLSVIERCADAGVRYRFMTALTREALPHLKELVRFSEERGAEMLSLIVLGMSGAAARNDHHFPTYRQWADAIVDLTRFLHTRGPRFWVSLLFPHEDEVPLELYAPLREAGILHLMRDVWLIDPERPVRGRSRCEAGQNGVAILANGDVYGCELMQGIAGYRAGNLREESLGAIFTDSPVFARLRARPVVKHAVSFDAGSTDYSCGQCRGGMHHLTRRKNTIPIVAAIA